jgi:ABC-type glycerol-3-phosphate transport system substrate-binding protein
MKKLFLALAVAGSLLAGACENPAKPSPSGGGAIAVTFSSLTANGSSTATTTKLTLTFSNDITNLAATDITLTPNSTGAQKGTLTRTGTGEYELTVSGITASGQISVSVSANSLSDGKIPLIA